MHVSYNNNDDVVSVHTYIQINDNKLIILNNSMDKFSISRAIFFLYCWLLFINIQMLFISVVVVVFAAANCWHLCKFKKTTIVEEEEKIHICENIYRYSQHHRKMLSYLIKKKVRRRRRKKEVKKLWMLLWYTEPAHLTSFIW